MITCWFNYNPATRPAHNNVRSVYTSAIAQMVEWTSSNWEVGGLISSASMGRSLGKTLNLTVSNKIRCREMDGWVDGWRDMCLEKRIIAICNITRVLPFFDHSHTA